MDCTDIMIKIIDRCQTIYEWFVRLFGNVVDLFARIKDFVLDLVYYVKNKFSTESEIEAFLRNYLEDEQLFV